MTEAETVILLQHRKSGDVVIEAQTVGQRVWGMGQSQGTRAHPTASLFIMKGQSCLSGGEGWQVPPGLSDGAERPSRGTGTVVGGDAYHL
jgi:hypothetical protein